MFISLFTILLFTIIAILLVIFCFFLQEKTKSTESHCKELAHQKAESTNFFSLFCKSLEIIDENDNPMNSTARYIADMVEAESVCIFELHDDYLRAEGICGAFPLVHNISQYSMTKPKYILELLHKEKFKLGEGIIGEAAAAREPMLITDAANEPGMSQFPDRNKVSSMMLVPMVEDAVLTGIICVVNNRHAGSFTIEQFSRLRSICPQVVISHKMYRSYNDSKERQRLSQEVEFARQLQASLLPEEFPDTYPFQIHAHTRSSKEVSGDFYDFIMIDENRLLVVIADACGKGIPACMLMAMTRSFIRSLVEHFTTVEELMMELNKNLYRDTDEERFVTLACCLLDRRNSLIEYARAGHTELITFVHGHIRKIYPEGTALGILPCEMSKYDSICLSFAEGMGLLLFTDGITEVINSQGEEFGVARLQDEFKKSLLNGDEPEDTINNILIAVDNFSTDPDTYIDDQTMVIIRHSTTPDIEEMEDSDQS